MRKIAIVLACVFCSISLKSQDIHFTLYDMMPLAFNPAETGGFYGSFRISGIYRDQWLSVASVPNQFKTPSFSVDVPIIKGFRDQDWVGVGLLFYSDKAGTIGLTNGSFKISAAYHLGLDKKGRNVIAVGYQTGSVRRRITMEGLGRIELASDQYMPGQFTNDPRLQGMGELENSYLDHVVGVHFRSRQDQGGHFQLGVSVGHIGTPDGSLLGGGGGGTNPPPGPQPDRPTDLDMNFVVHADWRKVTGDRFAIRPSVLAQFQGQMNEINAQFHGEYLLNSEKELVLLGGLGYRLGDAIQVMAGMDIKSLRVMLSFDVNTSRLTAASGGFGGFELAAVYVGKIYKRPDPDPILFCPRF